MDEAGQVRPGYGDVLARLKDLGPDGLERQWALGQRVMRENGVSYNAAADEAAASRPWVLDPVPRVIDPGEWATLSADLVQRAQLLEALYNDFYGPQQLLERGAVPPALVLNHPGFLHPCHGMMSDAGAGGGGLRPLGFLAFDLARAPDGRWWVLADRTQGPTGAGYALENRQATARTLPDLIKECRVERLAGFFAGWRDALRAASPRDLPQPRVVLLSPGPQGESYFEHTFLARYLGFTLVQGADLTVRDRVVFMKTVGGLRRVDVIVRRVDDAYCDPLELRGDSTLGVAGLLQAIRAGNVVVTNAPGSGVLATPALTPFYPALCRTLLGEELRLNTVATWWCGQEDAREYVEANLRRLVLKPAFPGARAQGPDGRLLKDVVFGDQLSDEDVELVIDQLREYPGSWIAQENVNLSTSPVYDGERLRPRHMVLRVFVAASEQHPGGFHVMPGGLTRVSAAEDSRLTAMQVGGGSKDTWVRSESPVQFRSLLPAPGTVRSPMGATFDLPSRVADDLFWLGRYVERAEATARLLRALAARLEVDAAGTGADVRALTDGLVEVTYGDEPPEGAADEPPAVWMRAALAVPSMPGGLTDGLTRARRLAATLRDRLSPDIGRTLAGLAPPTREVAPEDVATALDQVILTLSAFAGLTAESVLRSQEYRFLDLGRRIERTITTAALVVVAAQTDPDDRGLALEAIMESMATAMTYRLRYLATPALEPTLELVLRDEANPRGLAFQLAAIRDHLSAMPRARAERPTAEEKRAGRLLEEVRGSDPARLAAMPVDAACPGCPPELESFMVRVRHETEALAELMAKHYLEHSLPLSELRRTWGEPEVPDGDGQGIATGGGV